MAAKVAMATEKTSLLKTFNNSSGFTLLEVLLVLAILGGIIGFGLPRMRSPQTNVRAVARQLSALAREVRNEARMKRMTYRIVFRMGESKDDYWVENAAGSYIIPSQSTLEKIQSMDEKERPTSPFNRVDKFGKKEKALPNGLYFGSIETHSTPQPITKGVAYVYFTPEGLTEQSVVQITDRKKLTWSLIFNPITGHADIVEKAISLKDVYN